MRTIKSLFTALAAGSLAVIMASSAFAAEVALDKTAYNATTNVIDATGKYTETDGQMTAIVIEADKWLRIGQDNTETEEIGDVYELDVNDLLYINQFAKADAKATLEAIGLKGALKEDTKYYVLLGGDNASEIQMLSITYTEGTVTYKFADVNEDGTVDASDVTRLLRHTTGIEALAYESDASKLEAICDINKDTDVNAADVTRLLRHTTGIEALEGVE